MAKLRLARAFIRYTDEHPDALQWLQGRCFWHRLHAEYTGVLDQLRLFARGRRPAFTAAGVAGGRR